MLDADTEYGRMNKNGTSGEKGSALLLSILVLSVFSLLGLVMTFNAVTGLRISDNYESRIRAESASIAGLNHAHILMRGLDHSAVLAGPDGTYDPQASYLNAAKEFEFRNPLPVVLAQSLDISDPDIYLSAIPDDGLINTGYYSGSDGIALIPLTGIAQIFSGSGEEGESVRSRYFVKVTDNNGESSEKTGDPTDNPFVDGDGEIIVRSIGIAGTVTEFGRSVARRNSLAVYEARFRKYSVFDFGPALVLLGSRIVSSFEGEYRIEGGWFPGIGVIDVDAVDMEQMIRSGPFGHGTISGASLTDPSIQDITGNVFEDPVRSSVMDAAYILDFTVNKAPAFADNYFVGDQSWNPENAPDIGTYDPMRPHTAPEQNPKVTVVHGDLEMNGNLSGAGLLIVTGEFHCLGDVRYSGLILVVGRGKSVLDMNGPGITGGLFTAGLVDGGGWTGFGSPVFSIRGNSRITANEDAVEMAVGLIPLVKTSFREIAGRDP